MNSKKLERSIIYKMNMYMYKVKRIIIVMSMFMFLWVGISTLIQAFKCKYMTQTELFLHIPKSFVCDWKKCK